jgi:hypothetical protein
MALIPSSAVLPTIGYPGTEKLSKNNYSLWKAHVTSALRSVQMMGYVNGTTAAPAKTVPTSSTDATPVTNPAYEEWEVKDQQVLHFLLSSLSRGILVQVVPTETAREAWTSIDDYSVAVQGTRDLHMHGIVHGPEGVVHGGRVLLQDEEPCG